MRKFYFVILSLLAVASVSAANITVRMGNSVVAPGSTAYFSDYMAEEYEAGVWDIIMNPHISIESDFFVSGVTVTAKCTTGHAIQMCAGGLCEQGAEVTKTDITLRKGSPLDIEFEFINSEYEGTAVPDITTVFTVQVPDQEAIEFTIVMGPSGASVDRVSVSDNVSFHNGTLVYSLQEPSNFAVYSITGVKMLAKNIDGSGTLSMRHLPAGIYVYTLRGKTGKFIIK